VRYSVLTNVTYDMNLGRTTEFSYTGKITDVCALLS